MCFSCGLEICATLEVDGGWACCLRLFLEYMLLNPCGLAMGGVPLPLDSGPVMLFARLSNILADGEGHMKAFDWKGASALKPCLKHGNVTKKVGRSRGSGTSGYVIVGVQFYRGVTAVETVVCPRGTGHPVAQPKVPSSSATDLDQGSDLASRATGFVEISCSNAASFRTNLDFRKNARLLHLASARFSAGEMSKATFDELQIASGFRHNPYSIALSEPLRLLFQLPDVINYDWVHSALQGGTFTSEVEAFLEATAVPRADIHGFLANSEWQYPGCTRQKSKYLHRVFDSHRAKSSQEPGTVKASCSELLGLYGILRVFFELRFAEVDEFKQHLESFCQACSVLDMILDLKRGLQPINPDTIAGLQASMGRHLQKHVEVYTDAHVLPKHHWMLDTPAQFLKDSVVLDAFVIERTHLAVKGLAEHIKNIRVFERSVLSGMLCCLADADDEMSSCRLLGRTSVWPGTFARVADRAVVYGMEFAVGDVILRGPAVGLLKACALENGELTFMVQELRFARDFTRCCGSYEQSPGLVLWSAIETCHALAWRIRPDGTFFVVCR